MASVVGCFVADAYTSARLSANHETRKDHHMNAHASITVRLPREEAQRRWRAFAQDTAGDARLAPIEIVREEPGRLTEWRTPEGADTRASGVTRFVDAPGERGTEIHVSLEFEAPGGALGAVAQKLQGDEPRQLVADDLRRLKQLVEAGEIARSDGAPTGSSAREQPKQRPAQPLEHAHA
jgi:uncharacterized membrane protein